MIALLFVLSESSYLFNRLIPFHFSLLQSVSTIEPFITYSFSFIYLDSLTILFTVGITFLSSFI